MKEVLPFKGVERVDQLARIGLIAAASILVTRVLLAANKGGRTEEVNDNAKRWQDLDLSSQNETDTPT